MACLSASHSRVGPERRQHRSTIAASAKCLAFAWMSPAMSATLSSTPRICCQRVAAAGIKPEESPVEPAGSGSCSSTSAALPVSPSVNAAVRPQAPPPMITTGNFVSNATPSAGLTRIVITLHQPYA